MKLSCLPAVFVFVAVLAVSRADQPAPQEARWAIAVATLTRVLDGSADRETLDPLLSDHSWVAPFARNRTESVSVLPAILDGMRVVSTRASLHPAVSSASDLVADIQADPTIAESIRKKLVPAEDRELRQADGTMARWFSSALDAQSGDPVALIAMYSDGQPRTPTSAASPPSVTLLLIRGEFAADGSPRISRLLYGTLEAAVR